MNVIPFRTAAEVSLPPRTVFPGFDTVRAMAAIGVVLLHACVPYLRHPMPGLAWPVRDSQSNCVDLLFWSIELFIMPVFLVLAGFLAWQTLSHRGPLALVRGRTRRLLRPLLFGIVVILPMDLYAWLLGWVAEGLIPVVKLKSLKIASPLGDDLWGLSHLWFLQYLFLYVVAAACCFAAVKRYPSLQRLRPRPAIAAIGLMVVAAATLVLRPDVVWGFQHAFEPVPSKWIYSGTFFLGGIGIAISDPQLLWLRQRVGRLIGPAVLLGFAAVAMGRWHLAGGEGNLAAMTLASLTVASAWMITLVGIGVAARIPSVSPKVKYLAAASFWVYLVHHPILGIVHLDLKWLLPETAPVVKTALAFGATMLASLLSYEAMIRRTRLGRWLGFAWPDVGAASPLHGRKDADHGETETHSQSEKDQETGVPPVRRAA